MAEMFPMALLYPILAGFCIFAGVILYFYINQLYPKKRVFIRNGAYGTFGSGRMVGDKITSGSVFQLLFSGGKFPGTDIKDFKTIVLLGKSMGFFNTQKEYIEVVKVGGLFFPVDFIQREQGGTVDIRIVKAIKDIASGIYNLEKQTSKMMDSRNPLMVMLYTVAPQIIVIGVFFVGLWMLLAQVQEINKQNNIEYTQQMLSFMQETRGMFNTVLVARGLEPLPEFVPYPNATINTTPAGNPGILGDVTNAIDKRV